MIGPAKIIECRQNPKIQIKALEGHFAMTHSHTNFYVDILEVKHNQTMAELAAETLAQAFSYQVAVDTIVCIDGSSIIGAFFARALSKGDRYAVNWNKPIHVITPELQSSSQMIFRDNLQPHVRDKKVLILCGSVLTGKNMQKTIDCVEYYGGTVVGLASIFSVREEVRGIKVNYLFDATDVPGYDACRHQECSLCKAGKKIDAMANSYGYSVISW